MAQGKPAGGRLTRRALYGAAVGFGVGGLALLGAGIYEGFFAGRQTGDLVGGISGGPLVGQPAPAFTVTAITGATITLSSYLGKPLLLNFWATWCIPCRQELPALQRFAIDQGGRWAVLGVDELEQAAAVGTFGHGLGVTYPLAVDSDGSIAQHYRVQGLPTSFLVDTQGIVRQTHLGALDSATLRQWGNGA